MSPAARVSRPKCCTERLRPPGRAFRRRALCRRPARSPLPSRQPTRPPSRLTAHRACPWCMPRPNLPRRSRAPPFRLGGTEVSRRQNARVVVVQATGSLSVPVERETKAELVEEQKIHFLFSWRIHVRPLSRRLFSLFSWRSWSCGRALLPPWCTRGATSPRALPKGTPCPPGVDAGWCLKAATGGYSSVAASRGRLDHSQAAWSTAS